MILGMIIGIFFLNTILVITNQIKIIDDVIYNIIFSIRNDYIDIFFKLITKLGNTSTVIIIGILLLMILPKKEKLPILISIPTTAGINFIIKHIIKRTRPNHIRLIRQGGYSYPSGHTMISIAVYGILLYYVQKNIQNKRIKIFLSILLCIIIISIGISRIYVGVHYPSDIIGGYTLSIIIQWIIMKYFYKQIGGKTSDKNGCK